MRIDKRIGIKSKQNFVVDARCDGELKSFTVKNCCNAHLSRTATKVAQSLFMASTVFIIKSMSY